MTIEWLWALVASLTLLVIAAGIKINEGTALLKTAENEIAHLRAELTVLNDNHNIAISDIKQLHTTTFNKITETYQKEIENLNRQIRLANIRYPEPKTIKIVH